MTKSQKQKLLRLFAKRLYDSEFEVEFIRFKLEAEPESLPEFLIFEVKPLTILYNHGNIFLLFPDISDDKKWKCNNCGINEALIERVRVLASYYAVPIEAIHVMRVADASKTLVNSKKVAI